MRINEEEEEEWEKRVQNDENVDHVPCYVELNWRMRRRRRRRRRENEILYCLV